MRDQVLLREMCATLWLSEACRVSVEFARQNGYQSVHANGWFSWNILDFIRAKGKPMPTTDVP